MQSLKSKLKHGARTLLQILGLRPPVQDGRKERWNRRQSVQLNKHEKMDEDDFIDLFKRAGLQRGDTLWLQSSWDTLSVHKLNPVKFITALQDTIGKNGLIVMPAFVDPKDAQTSPIDFSMVPSDTGMLTEIFRRSPGVRRSSNIFGSVCVWGNKADEVVAHHQDCENAFSKGSPFEYLLKTNALCVSLGFGTHPTFLTPLHLLEGLNHHEIPAFKNSFGDEVEFKWIDDRKMMGSSRTRIRNGYVNVTILPLFIGKERFFLEDYKTGNLVAMRCDDLYHSAKPLAEKGITIYRTSKLYCRALNLFR